MFYKTVGNRQNASRFFAQISGIGKEGKALHLGAKSLVVARFLCRRVGIEVVAGFDKTFNHCLTEFFCGLPESVVELFGRFLNVLCVAEADLCIR